MYSGRKGHQVTLIRQWRGAAGDLYVPQGQSQLTGNFPAIVGETLIRTLLTVQLWEFFNTPSFPPLPPGPVAVGYYQNINSSSLSGIPTISNLDADHVCSGVAEFFADFGVTSAVQSDLTYHASITFDVKSERKALVSNPSFGVSFANIGGGFGGLSRVRQCTFAYVMRALWQHNI
jgi:hypothetical protein